MQPSTSPMITLAGPGIGQSRSGLDAASLRRIIDAVQSGETLPVSWTADHLGDWAAVCLSCATNRRPDLSMAQTFTTDLLPMWNWEVRWTAAIADAQAKVWLQPPCDEFSSQASSPARALVLATLKACLALAEARHG